MPLREVDAAFRAEGFNRITFLLDASTLSDEKQEAVISLVKEVLYELRASVKRTIYFLGNPSPYSPHQFNSHAAQWFQENRQRASLVTPIFEKLAPNDKSDLVVIGSEKIFDLEDWSDTPFLSRLTQVCLDETCLDEPLIPKLVRQPAATELCQELYDPVTRVEITGPGFMPTYWNQNDYQLEIQDENIRLIARNLENPANYSITLRSFILQPNQLQATIIRLSGDELIETLTLFTDSVSNHAEVDRLSPEERNIFRQARQRQEFTCLYCEERHSWDTLRCSQEGILGRSVYPTLHERYTGGFVILDDTGREVQFTLHPGSVFRLDHGKVAIKEGREAPIYRFDAGRECWLKTKEVLHLYQSLEGDAYVIFL